MVVVNVCEGDNGNSDDMVQMGIMPGLVEDDVMKMVRIVVVTWYKWG